MRKLTFADIVSKFDFMCYELVTTESDFSGREGDIKFICPTHKDKGVLVTKWRRVIRPDFKCKYCSNERRAKNQMHTIQFARCMFKLRGYKLLAKEYKGINVKMPCICLTCGTKNSTTLSIVKNGSICRNCSNERESKRHRYDYEFVRSKFEEKGYKLLTKYYKNSKQKLKYICPNHAEKVLTITFNRLNAYGQGCRYCAISKISGSNSNFWNGGRTPLTEYLRNQINTWKMDSMRKCNYKCVITGKKFDAVHHLYPRHKILDETLKELSFPINRDISSYTPNDLNLLSTAFLNNHYKYPLGACLTSELHDEFHKTYGYFEFTPEDFYEFKRLKRAEFLTTLKRKAIKKKYRNTRVCK